MVGVKFNVVSDILVGGKIIPLGQELPTKYHETDNFVVNKELLYWPTNRIGDPWVSII